MTLPAATVSILLAALLAFSAVRKLGHRPEVVRTYTRVGVPEDKLDYLAVVLLVGAAGLLLGLLWTPIGIVAAAAVLCYFVVAIGFHVRAHDARNAPAPLAIGLIAAVTLILRLAAS